MFDFVLILSLLYYWPFGVSAFVLGSASENAKKKTIASSWFQRKLNFLEKCDFWPLLRQSWIYKKEKKKVIQHIKFLISDIKSFLFDV